MNNARWRLSRTKAGMNSTNERMEQRKKTDINKGRDVNLVYPFLSFFFFSFFVSVAVRVWLESSSVTRTICLLPVYEWHYFSVRERRESVEIRNWEEEKEKRKNEEKEKRTDLNWKNHHVLRQSSCCERESKTHTYTDRRTNGQKKRTSNFSSVD